MKCSLRNLAAGLGAALFLAACGGGSDDSSPPAETSLPVADAGNNQTVNMGDTVTLQGSGTSPNNGVITYTWTLAGKPTRSTATLNGDTTPAPSFTADLPGSYTADLIVHDDVASSKPARVVINAHNTEPVAITQTQYSVRLGTATLGLDGTPSLAPTGASGPLAYLWTLLEKPEGSAGSVADYTSGNATLHLDLAGTYILQLVVSHNGKDSQPARVEVNVSSGNAPPVAVAKDLTIKLGEVARPDGSASYDPDHQPLQYRWRFAQYGATPSYVPVPELSNANSAHPSFTPVAVGDYLLEFFVYDGNWQSTIQKVKVTVTKPDSFPGKNLPIVGALSGKGYYPSSSVGEQEVGGRANFMFEGYDPEGEPIQLIKAELIAIPQGSTATLVEALPGSGMPTYQKIQKLDLAGDYTVRMTVSDGVNEFVSTATVTAKIGGINNTPLAGTIKPITASVLVNEPMLFLASSASDPDDDPFSFHWSLFDKPDGSQAALVAEIEPESREYRRARLIPDVPGVYTVRLEVEDDRGMRSSTYAQTQAIAKLVNNPPEIRRIAYRTQHTQLRDAAPYQLLPCMVIPFTPVVIDPDGDTIYTHRTLISKPDGGNHGNNRSSGLCKTSSETFSLPGEYVFRYQISDGIADLPDYDFTINIAPLSAAQGIVLADVFSAGTASEQVALQPWPYQRQVAANYGGGSSTPGTIPLTEKTFRLTAMDGDYTIVDVKGEHINGNLARLTPYFTGLAEGQRIAKGSTAEIKLMSPVFNCLRNDATLYEGFRWTFRIKEIPEQTFVYEHWRGAVLNNGATPWPQCDAAS
ncbi:PKD domain-containing protein [Kerstersia similis]|uniref:PKD domain-containing protein n=1 Tax=Kerstersia similis TaxID=206505 RepID=UPI0039F0C42F